MVFLPSTLEQYVWLASYVANPWHHLVLGMDIAGEVIDAGKSTAYKVGDRVLAPGVVGWSDGCS
jgi:NADPH:quinone reductase-like Zn-dependent oxidoreductase